MNVKLPAYKAELAGHVPAKTGLGSHGAECMTEIQIGEIESRVDVVDAGGLLAPATLQRIVLLPFVLFAVQSARGQLSFSFF